MDRMGGSTFILISITKTRGGRWWIARSQRFVSISGGSRQIEPMNQSRLQVALETVLNDENGIDVGAGAFFLIYSRSLSETLKSEWPKALVSPILLPFDRIRTNSSLELLELVSRSVQQATYNRNSVPSGSRPRR